MNTIPIVKATVFSCLFLTAPAVNNLAAKTTSVSTIEQLADANSLASPGDTVSLEDATYQIKSYGIAVRTPGLTFKSASGHRDNVVISGAGYAGNIEYGFWVDAHRITIRDLTIQNVYYHCIQTNVTIDSLTVINCVLRDAREQLLKVPFNGSVNDPSEGGLVEGCLFEFSSGIASQYYTGGIDCHFAKNWIVRNNVFKWIRSPDDQVAEHAIHFWNNSEGTLVENNLIVNCDRGIGFGLGDSPHKGGIIRNNIISHHLLSEKDNGDVGIGLESCTDTKVYNNTIYFYNPYPNAVEYRFSATKNVFIANNLTNKAIAPRDGASGQVANNVTNAQIEWFVSSVTDDLHILSTAANVIDKGIAIAGLTFDFDGQPRRAESIDIGADEFSSNRVLQFSGRGKNGCLRLDDRFSRGADIRVFDILGRRAGMMNEGSGAGETARSERQGVIPAAGTYVIELHGKNDKNAEKTLHIR